MGFASVLLCRQMLKVSRHCLTRPFDLWFPMSWQNDCCYKKPTTGEVSAVIQFFMVKQYSVTANHWKMLTVCGPKVMKENYV